MGSLSRIAQRFGLLLALTVTVGFISSFVSRGNCEAHAAGEIAQGLRASLGVSDRRVYVLPDDGDPAVRYPGSEQILRRNGFTITRCQLSGQQFDCFPWAGVADAKVVGPFLVDVSYGFVAAPLSGYGTRMVYCAFFGLVFPVHELGGWVT